MELEVELAGLDLERGRAEGGRMLRLYDADLAGPTELQHSKYGLDLVPHDIQQPQNYQGLEAPGDSGVQELGWELGSGKH